MSQVVIVHGFSEHMGYYQSLAKKLSEEGVATHMMDLPGHGMAEGIRGHIDLFDEYLDNLELLITQNPHFLKTKPVFLLGHSMGGLIAAHYCLKRSHRFKGLILTSPLTGFPPAGFIPVYMLARFLARKSRNTPIPKPMGVKSLSRNPRQWQVYYSDPCRGRVITPNLFLAMTDKTKELQNLAPSMKLPLLMFITDKDKVVSPQAGQRFFSNVRSKDKSLVVFSEAMHEIFQEVESEQVISTMLSWIKDRI